ncbi:ATPase [Gordonia araii NBRC 100433]|nr:ATPase [Gordonia araii NBRC 100433]
MTADPHDPSNASRVLVALRVRADRERAFAVFTEQIGQWWRPNQLFQFRPGHTGTMAFELGPRRRLVERYADGTEFTVGLIREWDPPRKLAVGWRQAGFRDDQDTELHVTFEPVDDRPDETRVVVEHFGWDRIPPESAARHGFPLPVFQLRFAQWWREQLASAFGGA